MKTPVGIQIGVHGHQLFFQRDRTDKIKEKGFTRSVLTHHNAKARTSVNYTLDVLQKRVELTCTTDLNEVLPDARYDAGTEGLQNRIAVLGTDRCHAANL
jgi:hypothetical protein